MSARRNGSFFKTVSMVMAMACSGCVSGLPIPPGNVWRWVSETPQGQVLHELHQNEANLKTRLDAEFGRNLPMTVRNFEDMLAAEHFTCEFSPPWTPHNTNARECVYFQKGPTQANSCFSGTDVAIAITYTYPDESKEPIVKSFETRVIMGIDGKAHGSGPCFPL